MYLTNISLSLTFNFEPIRNTIFRVIYNSVCTFITVLSCAPGILSVVEHTTLQDDRPLTFVFGGTITYTATQGYCFNGSSQADALCDVRDNDLCDTQWRVPYPPRGNFKLQYIRYIQ